MNNAVRSFAKKCTSGLARSGGPGGAARDIATLRLASPDWKGNDGENVTGRRGSEPLRLLRAPAGRHMRVGRRESREHRRFASGRGLALVPNEAGAAVG